MALASASNLGVRTHRQAEAPPTSPPTHARCPPPTGVAVAPALTRAQDGSRVAAPGRGCGAPKPGLALAAELDPEALLGPWLRRPRQPGGQRGLDLLPARRARLTARARPGHGTLPVGTIDQ